MSEFIHHPVRVVGGDKIVRDIVVPPAPIGGNEPLSLRSVPTFLRRVAFRVVWSTLGLVARDQKTLASLIRVFGGHVGRDVHIAKSVRILDPKNLKIGDGTVLRPHVSLLCYDPVTIGSSSRLGDWTILSTRSINLEDKRRRVFAAEVHVKSRTMVHSHSSVGPVDSGR